MDTENGSYTLNTWGIRWKIYLRYNYQAPIYIIYIPLSFLAAIYIYAWFRMKIKHYFDWSIYSGNLVMGIEFLFGTMLEMAHPLFNAVSAIVYIYNSPHNYFTEIEKHNPSYRLWLKFSWISIVVGTWMQNLFSMYLHSQSLSRFSKKIKNKK